MTLLDDTPKYQLTFIDALEEASNYDFIPPAASAEGLKVELLDTEKFIRVNNCQEITNPVF